MKKYNALLIIIAFFSIQGFCQKENNIKLDSLLNLLKIAKEDTNKVTIFNHLFREYEFLDDKKAQKYLNKALKLSVKINFKKGLANTYFNLGYFAENKGNYPEALKNYYTSLRIRAIINDKKGIASSYNNIGTTYFNLGNYPEALKNYFASLKIKEEMGNKKSMVSSYNNIGNVYERNGNYQEALKNYSAALKIIEEINYKKGIPYTYNNIGNVYLAQANYSEALKNYFASLKIAIEISDKVGVAYSYISIGEAYSKQADSEQNNALRTKQYEEALKNYFSSLKIWEEIDYKKGMADSYCNIGELLIKQKKYIQAERYLIKALELSKKTGNKATTRNAYNSLTYLYSITGNFKDAYENHKLYILYRDSLVNEANTIKIAQSQMQYEFDKKDAESKAIQDKKDALIVEQNKIKELQLSRAKFITFTLVVLILLIFVIGLLFFRQNKLKSEQKLMQLEQKLLRLQMNPHFIFNSLQSIQNFITEKEAIKYLSSLGALTRSILENSRMESIPLYKELIILKHYLELQKLLHKQQFNYSIHVAPDLDTENINIPPMLSQPFIENAIEHGMRDIESGGQIDISFSTHNNTLFLEIKDNGKGISTSHNKKNSSLATTITKERIFLFNKKKSRKASFTITEAYPNEIRKGLKINFSIPI